MRSRYIVGLFMPASRDLVVSVLLHHFKIFTAQRVRVDARLIAKIVQTLAH